MTLPKANLTKPDFTRNLFQEGVYLIGNKISRKWIRFCCCFRWSQKRWTLGQGSRGATSDIIAMDHNQWMHPANLAIPMWDITGGFLPFKCDWIGPMSHTLILQLDRIVTGIADRVHEFLHDMKEAVCELHKKWIQNCSVLATFRKKSSSGNKMPFNCFCWGMVTSSGNILDQCPIEE